ncbi:MAG TPA: cellulase family glycosylhydrolase [Trebonia sp.]|nr:cellulase family glycosylhydrolase [Trebonia sp.]
MRLLPRRARSAIAAIGAALLAALGLAVAGSAGAVPAVAATSSCSAAYSVQSDWGSGFTASLTVTNNGTAAITGWTVTYTYVGNQTLANGWNGNWTQSGKTVTVTNESYNGSLAVAANTSAGANFNYSGTNVAPTAVTCTPAGSTSPPPTPAITTSSSSLQVLQGNTATVGIDLSIQPSANVTVSVARSSGNTGLTAAPATLTFTPSNYATDQNVTITADSSSTGAATFTASATGYTSGSFTVTEVTPTTSAAPQLHVSGNKLLDAGGNQVVLHGVDRSGTEYACVQGNGIFDGPNDQASITAMKSWGPVNAVRVPLNEACWNAESYVNSAYAGTNYINAIKAYVSLLNSNGIVAILDLHWTDGSYTGPSAGSCTSSEVSEAFCQKPMPDAAEAIPFWTSVANTFKGNNAVIFDLFNEPFASRADNNNTTEGWQCWETGSPCTGISYPVAGMQQMVNAVRSTGASNVLMLGGEEYSNDLTDWLQYEPTDPDHNLVASWHSYNFNTCSTQSCWTSQVAPVAASVPVVAGEIGENDCAGTYITPLTTWLESEGISFLAWAWNADFACSSGPGLITDYTGTPTAYGAAYKSILQALPAG